MGLIVSPLAEVPMVVEALRPSHIVTLLDPGEPMERPRSIAHIEELPPKWQLTRRTGRPISAVTYSPTYWWEAPWKPYLRTPKSSRHSGGTP